MRREVEAVEQLAAGVKRPKDRRRRAVALESSRIRTFTARFKLRTWRDPGIDGYVLTVRQGVSDMSGQRTHEGDTATSPEKARPATVRPERRPMGLFGIVAVALGAALVASLATVAALSVGVAPTQRFSAFEGDVADSAFTLEKADAKPKGLSRIDLSVAVKNADATAHAANVTVQLFDAADVLLYEETQSTGTVQGEASKSLRFEASAPDLVAQYANYVVLLSDEE